MGRPTDYTDELADQICALISGGQTLKAICAQDGFPSAVSVFAWLRKYPEFLNNYTRAREAQADVFADEITAIADECEAKTDEVSKARLRVDARKWVAAKLKPKKYGDSVLTKHADADGNALKFSSILESLNGRTASIPSADKPVG